MAANIPKRNGKRTLKKKGPIIIRDGRNIHSFTKVGKTMSKTLRKHGGGPDRAQRKAMDKKRKESNTQKALAERRRREINAPAARVAKKAAAQSETTAGPGKYEMYRPPQVADDGTSPATLVTDAMVRRRTMAAADARAESINRAALMAEEARDRANEETEAGIGPRTQLAAAKAGLKPAPQLTIPDARPLLWDQWQRKLFHEKTAKHVAEQKPAAAKRAAEQKAAAAKHAADQKAADEEAAAAQKAADEEAAAARRWALDETKAPTSRRDRRELRQTNLKRTKEALTERGWRGQITGDTVKIAGAPFQASEASQVSLAKNESVRVMEKTSLPGWLKVRKGDGSEGYVPSSILDDPAHKVPRSLADWRDFNSEDLMRYTDEEVDSWPNFWTTFFISGDTLKYTLGLASKKDPFAGSLFLMNNRIKLLQHILNLEDGYDRFDKERYSNRDVRAVNAMLKNENRKLNREHAYTPEEILVWMLLYKYISKIESLMELPLDVLETMEGPKEPPALGSSPVDFVNMTGDKPDKKRQVVLEKLKKAENIVLSDNVISMHEINRMKVEVEEERTLEVFDFPDEGDPDTTTPPPSPSVRASLALSPRDTASDTASTATSPPAAALRHSIAWPNLFDAIGVPRQEQAIQPTRDLQGYYGFDMDPVPPWSEEESGAAAPPPLGDEVRALVERSEQEAEEHRRGMVETLASSALIHEQTDQINKRIARGQEQSPGSTESVTPLEDEHEAAVEQDLDQQLRASAAFRGIQDDLTARIDLLLPDSELPAAAPDHPPLPDDLPPVPADHEPLPYSLLAPLPPLSDMIEHTRVQIPRQVATQPASRILETELDKQAAPAQKWRTRRGPTLRELRKRAAEAEAEQQIEAAGDGRGPHNIHVSGLRKRLAGRDGGKEAGQDAVARTDKGSQPQSTAVAGTAAAEWLAVADTPALNTYLKGKLKKYIINEKTFLNVNHLFSPHPEVVKFPGRTVERRTALSPSLKVLMQLVKTMSDLAYEAIQKAPAAHPESHFNDALGKLGKLHMPRMLPLIENVRLWQSEEIKKWTEAEAPKSIKGMLRHATDGLSVLSSITIRTADGDEFEGGFVSELRNRTFQGTAADIKKIDSEWEKAQGRIQEWDTYLIELNRNTSNYLKYKIPVVEAAQAQRRGGGQTKRTNRTKRTKRVKTNKRTKITNRAKKTNSKKKPKSIRKKPKSHRKPTKKTLKKVKNIHH